MVSSKILWNSVISTKDPRFAGANSKNLYLKTPLNKFEYMKILIALLSDNIIKHYWIQEKVLDGYLTWRYTKECTDCLWSASCPTSSSRNFEQPHTLGLWKHVTHSVQFNKCVDNFGIKYIGQDHLQLLYDTLQKEAYEIVDDVGEREGYSSRVVMDRRLRRSMHHRARILSRNSMDVQRGKDW
jgi:hypothetical protein